MDSVVWKVQSFDQLSIHQFYEILKIRQAVFVVEQNCPYLDADGYDEQAFHLWGAINGEIVAYCRIFAPDIKYPEASIGRVLTHPNYRSRSYGKTMLRIAIEILATRYPKQGIKISAQDYLLHFYHSFGFAETGLKYLEDDIPHSEMLRK